MLYSYVMGIDKSIFELQSYGFVIEQDGENYCVSFDEKNAAVWEDFICKHLELNFWNEYLTENGVIFLFHLDDGFRRFVVEDYENDEVKKLCEKL